MASMYLERFDFHTYKQNEDAIHYTIYQKTKHKQNHKTRIIYLFMNIQTKRIRIRKSSIELFNECLYSANAPLLGKSKEF